MQREGSQILKQNADKLAIRSVRLWHNIQYHVYVTEYITKTYANTSKFMDPATLIIYLKIHINSYFTCKCSNKT
jgi:hypothetical protein